MKVKLYNRSRVIKTIDCNDIDRIDNPAFYADDVIRVHMRDNSSELCDEVVFMLEGEEE